MDIQQALLNGDTILENMDMANMYNPVTAIIKTYKIAVTDGKGLRIDFKPKTGNTIISGLKIKAI